jgi:CubicO group peptidase (beta-lactamase class C family)
MKFSKVMLGAALGGVCWGRVREASPESVGMDSAALEQLERNMSDFNVHPPSGESHPVQPGSAVVVGHEGVVVSRFATGYAQLYADANGTKLPEHERRKTEVDTIYDLASLSKLFTTIAALREIDNGRICICEPVAKYVPEFAQNGKGNVTIEQLLTHTSGFDAEPEPPLYDTDEYRTVEERRRGVLASKLLNRPGEKFVYSDINFMTMQQVLERVTGRRLDDLVGEYTRMLGMHDTYYNRGNRPLHADRRFERTVAEEFQIAVMGDKEPKRPQPVRGTVHDENAYSLDGVSGHAGVFSTVDDVAVLCQMILNNGTYNGRQILSQDAVNLIFHNFNTRFPEDAHGLGFELNQAYWSGPMANPLCAGHTGFTGTTLAIDRASNTFFILFANKVHPTREWPSNNVARQALGYWVAKALGRDV